MDTEELTRYKNMSVNEIDQRLVPDIEDIKNKKKMDPLSMYFMKVGNVIVKCSYAGNGRSLADCFLSYLKRKRCCLIKNMIKGQTFLRIYGILRIK